MIQNTFLDVYKQEAYVGTEPVSLADAKIHCRVDFDDDDTILNDLITECRQVIEDYTHASLVTKIITLTLAASEVPSSYFAQPYQVREGFNVFELPYGPIQSVSLVSSIGSDLSIIALQLNEDYYLFGSAFQTIKISNNYDNNTLVYTAGYGTAQGTTPGPIPGPLKRAILNEIAYRYEARGEASNIRATAFTEEGICQAARALAKPYIRLNWQ